MVMAVYMLSLAFEDWHVWARWGVNRMGGGMGGGSHMFNVAAVEPARCQAFKCRRAQV
jgi:hypothetical protein